MALLSALMSLPAFGKDKSLFDHIHSLDRLISEYNKAFCLGLQSVAPGDLLCILPGVMATVTERKEQVATWNGDPVLWQDYVKRGRLQYERTPVKKRSLLGAELASRLTGRAWDVVSADLDHQRLQKPDGPAYLLQFLEQKLGKGPIPDSGQRLEDFFVRLRRSPGQSMAEWSTQLRESYRRLQRALARQRFVRFTFVFLTLARVSLSVSPFFSPLSLRRGVVVVCFGVIKSELLCLSACTMWSRGSWLGGSLVSAWCCVASLTCEYGLGCVCVPPFLLFVWFMAILWWDDTMLSPLAWICPWTGSQSFPWVLVFGFIFVLLWWFLFVCLVWLLVSGCGDDGLLDYVQVLHQFSFVALNSRWPRVLIWNYCFCNAIESVKRPGESHEGVGRKKNLARQRFERTGTTDDPRKTSTSQVSTRGAGDLQSTPETQRRRSDVTSPQHRTEIPPPRTIWEDDQHDEEPRPAGAPVDPEPHEPNVQGEYEQLPASEPSERSWQRRWTDDEWRDWRRQQRRWHHGRGRYDSSDEEDHEDFPEIQWEQFNFASVEVLPPEILGWLLLRRSGLPSSARLSVLSSINNNLDLDTMERDMRDQEEELLQAEAQRQQHGGFRGTREALLSEAGFEKVFRTQNWVHRSKLFCRWFCFLLGQAGCISVAAWTQLKVAFYYFVSSGGLIVCCWTKAHQPFAALGDCLKCFLLLRSLWVFAQVVGFHLNDCIEYFTAPCWPPLPL